MDNQNNPSKMPDELDAEIQPLIDSTPNPDYIEYPDCVGSHTGNEVTDLINS